MDALILALASLAPASLVANVVLLRAAARMRRALVVLASDSLRAARFRAACGELLGLQLSLLDSWRKYHEGRN